MESQLEHGNYRLLALLGRGGFADVYQGEHIHLQRPVAIKIFRERLDDEGMSLFLYQARLLARLEHQRVVRIQEFTVWDGHAALIMQYASRGTLRQRFPDGTRPSLAEVIEYIWQAATGLDFIHSKGLLHGDIKPENMLLDEYEELLLADFGLEQVWAGSGYGRSQGKVSIVGAVSYMAPEQAEGKPCPASDQYALGIVAFEWLCGRLPYQGTRTEIMTQHALGEPPSLLALRPDLPREVEAVILRVLAREPERRFPNARAFAAALEQAINPTGNHGPPADSLLTRRTMLTVGGLVAAGGLVGLGWLALNHAAEAGPAPFAGTPVVLTQPTYLYQQHQSELLTVAWSPDGTRIASSDTAGNTQVWQGVAQTPGEAVGTLLHVHGQMIEINPRTGSAQPALAGPLAWLADNQRLALVINSTFSQVRIWNSVSNLDEETFSQGALGACVTCGPQTQSNLVASVYSIEHTQSEELILTTSLAVWDSSTGNNANVVAYPIEQQLVNAPNLPFSVAWSPDGSMIAQGAGNRIIFWKLIAGVYQPFQHFDTTIAGNIAWSPDSQYLAVTGTPTRISSAYASTQVNIWQVTAGKQVLSYNGHQAVVNALAWSPHGQYIASASDDKTVRVWNVMNGTTHVIYRGHAASVSTLSWSHTFDILASGDRAGAIQLWQAGLSDA